MNATVCRVKLAAINLDVSIQCRAAIDTGIVNEYAEALAAGDTFPPVVLYGTRDECWIADGWHRVLAARQNGEAAIDADLHHGTRVDALKAALSANAAHGHRRTNADKRRAVEIALREFGTLSSRAIAEMCGVSDEFVRQLRPTQVPTVGTSPVTGRDGKQYPARREPAARPPASAQPAHPSPAPQHESEVPRPITRTLAPPSNGLQFARMALADLEQIRPDDLERHDALELIRRWLNAQETKT